MSAFVAAESAANPAAIRAAAADLDRVAGMITGRGQAVTQALNTAPPTFSDLFAEQLRDRVRQNETAWRSALSSVVYAAGVTRAWADDVEWFQAQQRALGAQVAAATAGTAGLTAPAITPGAPPETIANSLQQFSAAVDTRRAELNAQGSHQSGALLNQLQERAAQRAADLRSGPTPASLDRLDVAGALPGAASSIFAGTGWSPARPMADLLALVTAGLLPGSALVMNWKDLITKVTGEWAHLLDRSYPAIPDGSPLAGAFIPAVNLLTGGAHMRPVPAALEQAFAGLDASLALLLGGLYPRQLATPPTVPSVVRAVASSGLQSSGSGSGSTMAMNGGMPDLAAANTSLIGRLSQKVLASNDVFIDAWATGLTMFANVKNNPDPVKDKFFGDLSRRHNEARDKMKEVLEQIVAAGGDPTGLGLDFDVEKEVGTELVVRNGGTTSGAVDGRADIYYKFGNTIMFWEVKGSWKPVNKEKFDQLSATAAGEVDTYVKAWNQYHAADLPEETFHATAGFPVKRKVNFDFDDVDVFTGQVTTKDYVVGDGNPGDGGALVYQQVIPPQELGPMVRPSPVTPPPLSPPETSDLPKEAVTDPGEYFKDPNNFLPGPKVEDLFENPNKPPYPSYPDDPKREFYERMRIDAYYPAPWQRILEGGSKLLFPLQHIVEPSFEDLLPRDQWVTPQA